MIRTIFALVLVLAPLAQPASAAEYVLSEPHTQAEFVVTHLALSKVRGSIPMTSGTMTVGPNNLPTALTVTFNVAGLTTSFDRRDKDLRDNYFEVAKYPTMTFVERKAEGTPNAFKMTGDLTIHGVTKSVVVASKVDGVLVSQGKKHIAYSGTTTVDRRDFGMTFGPLLDGALIAGYEVTINLATDVVEP